MAKDEYVPFTGKLDAAPQFEPFDGTLDGEKPDGPLARGWNKAKQSMSVTSQLATGNAAGAAQTIKQADDYARANPGMQEGKELGAAWERGDGISGGISEVAGEFAKDWREAPGVIKGLRATGRNLRALGEGMVEQVPNMVAPVTGMVGGALAGSAAGSAAPIVGNVAGAAVGGWVGASAGNTLVEGGGMTQAALQKAGISPQDTAAVEKYLKEHGDTILGQSATKGAIIGAVDTLTAGLGGRLLNAPARAAADRALAGMGVNMADKAAVKAATQSPEFAAKIAGDATYQASKQGAGNIARNVGAAALDPAGEFAGEFVGQGVATGEWDTKNAALEAFSSIGQSGAMFAGQKAYQALTRPGAATNDPSAQPAPAQDEFTTSPGAADPNAPVPPGAAPVEAPDLQATAPATEEAPSPIQPEAVEPAPLTPEQRMAELDERMGFIDQQAKANGWDKRLIDARDETRAELDALRGSAPTEPPAFDASEIDPIRQMVKQAADAGGALSAAAGVALDLGVTNAQFLGATGRDMQLRQTGPGVADESNVIDVQGRVVEDRAIGTPRRLTAQESARESGAIAFQDGVPRSEIAAIPNVIHRAQQLRGYDDAAQKASSVPALPAPTNLREGLERIRAQQQEAANAQAATPQAAPAAQTLPTARPGTVEAAGVKTGGFDPAAFDNARANTIKASKAAGNKHLDEVPAYVESMRGKQVYYVHDNKVRGVIRTVDNRGNVYIDWADSYSAEKEMASPVKDGKKTVMRSSIGPTYLKDYVVGQPKVPAANVQPTTEGANLVPQASQTQQGSPQSTQTGGPQAGAATATASTSPAGGSGVQAAGLTDGTPTQNTGAQAAAAAGTQGQAPQTAVARPDGWRKSMLRAAPIARAMGIDPKGKRLAQVVAEIDARDTQTPTTPAPQPAPGPVRLGRNNQPLSEGGKPFKTRKAAGDAKKLQPMMRVVTVEGGYALAEKTPAQLAAEERASRRLRNPNTSAPGEPITAHAFIAAAGGLNRAAAADMGVDGNPRIGNRTLFAGQGRGLSMEQATQMLIQDGYLSEGASHNDAYALIKTSLTRPQYNADGIERIAQAESDARFEDYLAAHEEAAAEGDADPFGMADSFTAEELDDVGYTDADPALQAEVNALIVQADAMGIDTYAILDDIARTYADATQDEFNAKARDALAAAIARGNQDGGSTAAQASPAAEPAQEPGLTAPTRADIEAQQEARDKAEREEAARQRAADQAASQDENRKRIAQASVRAADTFELGQDPLDSLTGQGSMFDDAPEQPQKAPTATETVAQPITRADVEAAIQGSAGAPPTPKKVRAAEVVRQSVVKKTNASSAFPWQIIHEPTGEAVSGPPGAYPGRGVMAGSQIMGNRAWKTKREAEAALTELNRVADAVLAADQQGAQKQATPTATTVPAQVQSRIMALMRPLKDAADGLESARLSDRNFNGDGRYAAEMWLRVKDKVAAAKEAVEKATASIPDQDKRDAARQFADENTPDLTLTPAERRYLAGIDAGSADVPLSENPAPTEPNPLEHTPKQYADAWLRWSAETNGLPLAEVREMQGDEAGLKAIEQRWVDAVVQEAKSGNPLPSKTLDKLLEVRPNAQLPESAIPAGYQRSQARKQEADEKQARAANSKAAKQGAAEAAPISDFGEKLEGARKDMPPSLKEEVSDEKIASLPLSKIWPSDAHESIEDDVAAALTFAARQEIPSKPRVTSRVRAWVEKVKMFREIARDLSGRSLEGMERHISMSDKFKSLAPFFAKVRLLSQLPRDTWGRVERVEEYPNAIRYEKDGSKTAVAFSSVTIDGKSRRFEGVGKIGPDEVQAVKEMLGTAAPKKDGLTAQDFEVRGTAKTGYKINRKGDSEYRSLKIFTGEDAAKKALAWRDEHTAELEAAWEAVKARDNVSKAEVRRDENRERAGENRRNGKDVTEEMFDQALGFRGVQFGNWVGQGAEAKGRQGMLNDAYDALLDLADILGIPSKAISLNGTLGLSFGARGSGKAAAHFEPSNLVINLTKTRGAGSLAHEWFHALDNYFSRMRGGEVAFTGDNNAYRQNNYVTYKPEAAWGKAPITPYTNFMRGGQLRERLQRLPGFAYDANKTLAENAKAAGFERDPNHKDGVRPQVEKAFADLVQALNDSPMAERASALDKAADGYWGRIIERGARSFENYVISKMAQRGWSNDFLANIRSFDEWMAMGKNAERYPYLKPEEDAPVVEAFDKLFQTVETKEDDTGNVAMFSFAGARAATADTHALVTAQDRFDAGEDPETVRQETGWFKGVDGRMRFEISDADALLKADTSGAEGRRTIGQMFPLGYYGDEVGLTVGRMLHHPALFAAYPAIADIKVKMVYDLRGDDVKGSFNPSTNTITLNQNASWRDAMSTLLHEIQHGIQNIEGFATGDSPERLAKTMPDVQAINDAKLLARFMERGESAFDARQRFTRYMGRDPNPQGVYLAERNEPNEIARMASTPLDAYKRNAGEVEARNTQARQKLTAEQRRATSPSQTADVADADVIVVFNGKEMANAPMPANAVPDAAATVQPLRTPAATIRAAITKAYGKLLGQLESKGLVTLTQTQEQAIEAAAQARAKKTGEALDAVREQLLSSVRNSIAVWHGTPHRGIEKTGFKLNKIGTGEGAQAYGWGVYFASMREVAKEYADKLGGARVYFDKSEVEPSTRYELDVVDAINASLRTTQSSARGTRAREVWQQFANPLRDRLYGNAYAGIKPLPEADLKRALGLQEAALRLGEPSVWNEGQLYSLTLPVKESDLLDWDRPLSEQSQKVRNAMLPVARMLYPRKDIYSDDDLLSMTGEFIYKGLSGYRHGGPQAASSRLQAAGIPGLRYLDGNSRRDGNGSHNYVMWDESLMTPEAAGIDAKFSKNGSIQGFFDPQTGQSFLVADNLTAEAAPGVLMHEVGIHMAADGGMKALFNRAAMMLKMQRGNPFIKAVQARMDAAGETSGEEAAAYIAEAYENDRANAPASVQRWLADLLAAVKAWMFKKGIMGADRLTVADIAAVARANAKTLARGQQGVVVKRSAASFSRVSSEAPVDFSSDPRFHELFYGEPTQQQVAEFQRWLDANPETIVRLYHGTAAVNPVEAKGLLKTTASRRNSMQSTSGYVYLSVYPGMADSFARMAALNRGAGPQGKKHARYAVDMRVAELLPDADQLRNQRMFADRKVGNTLAESLVYGHAARVRGNVASERISLDGPMFSRTPGDQTQTENFRRWFAGSKAVDADGKPLRVYHGTHSSFTEFKPNDALGGGMFFSPSPEEAGAFTGATGSNIMPVYLSAQKVWPKIVRSYDEVKAIRAAKSKGYDAIRVRDDQNGVVNWVVFDPTQVKSAIGNNGDFDPANPDIRFSRTTEAAKAAGDAIKSVTVTNIKQRAGFKLTDYLGIGLQALGRRQIVDIYGDMLPLAEYNRLVTQMEADKNEGGAEADQLVTRWAKLPDEAKLADLMHDATLAQIDPAKPYVDGDDKARYMTLQGRFNALSAEAKQVYTDTRDSYQAHHAKVRSAIKERIERSEIKGERKAALLKQMDDEFFKAIKGVYFPLARFGQYAVTVKGPDGKVESVSRAETKAEAEALRNNLLSAFPRDKGFTVGRVMLSKDFIADRDAVGRGFMTELYQVLDKQDMDAAQRAELEDTLGQLYLSSLPDLSWAKHGIHRKGTPGFSQDARRAYAQNMFHGSRYLAKLRYSDLMQDELTAMQKHVDDWREVEDFDQNSAQRVVDEMNKRHESLMNPKSNPLSTALTSLGFVFHLGLSPASAMVNLSQTALVAYPIMGAKWGFNKASAALLKASADAAKGKNDITASLNEDERAAYDEAVRAGTIDVTMAHDLAGIAQGEDAGVMWKIRPIMRWASFFFHHAERFNRQVTFVAAYRLAREAGADQKAAFEQATKATYDGHFDYSSSNRPRIMQGNVAKVLLLFKQYGQNMVYTLSRNAYQSIKGTDAEKAEARKALAGLLASHAMAAGVLGLPMVTTLLAAASMIGGDDDEPWDAKVALQNMLADAFGQKPAEVLAHGLSRLTPWDISGRVGLDRLIFPDVQEGLEGQRLAESAMAAALGPVAGIGINVLKGMQMMGEGRYAMGLEAMMPAALRGPVKALRYAEEGVQDKSGISILDEVSPAAVAGQALGFSPSAARNAQEGKSAILAHDRALGERRQELLTKIARATMAKDEEAKAEAREEIKRFNEKNPSRRINPNHIMASVRGRQKRIDQAQDGVYLPRNRREAMEAGRFALPD